MAMNRRPPEGRQGKARGGSRRPAPRRRRFGCRHAAARTVQWSHRRAGRTSSTRPAGARRLVDAALSDTHGRCGGTDSDKRARAHLASDTAATPPVTVPRRSDLADAMTPIPTRRLSTLLISTTALAVATVLPAQAGTTITTVPSPTWGVYKACSATDKANCGSVYSITDVGGRVVLGGNFTDLVSSTGAKIPMSNLAELSESDGTPVVGFAAPALGGPAYVVASDGVNLYAGGHFPGSFAKIEPATGAILWRGSSSATAYALLPASGSLYVGGFMGIWRVSAATGVRDPSFAPRFYVAARAAAPMPRGRRSAPAPTTCTDSPWGREVSACTSAGTSTPSTESRSARSPRWTRRPALTPT